MDPQNVKQPSSSSNSDLETPSDHEVLEVKEVADVSTVEVGPESLDSLRNLIHDHQFDPNYPPDILARAQALIDDKSGNLNNEYGQRLLADIEAEHQFRLNDSPYAEVRSLVPPTDDPTVPVNTFRVWFLGTIFTILGSGINTLFGPRYPGCWITTYAAQLLSYPCGVAMARFLPTRRFGSGRWSMTLNPGHFNQKEHIVIGMMANVAFGNTTLYVKQLFTVLKLDVFFGEKVLSNSAAFRILVALSTQMFGFGLAGLTRRLLVYQPSMIWPGVFGQIAMNKALHNDDGQLHVPGWKMSRHRFFMYCFAGMFFYFWFPNYIFQALSIFNWTTWIAPQNVTLALVTGSLCGLGLNPWPTFDWNIVVARIDPIMSPFFSTMNYTVGAVIASFIIAPLLYWYNIANTGYLPLNSNRTFNKFGMRYDVSMVVNSDHTLNATAYESYGAPLIGAGFTIKYAADFAIIPAICCHFLLYNWIELKNGVMAMIRWKKPRQYYNDVHNRLMKAYPEVPLWWFGIIFVISFVFGIIICTKYPTGFPVWALVFAVVLSFIFQVVIGAMVAITNVWANDQILSSFIIGYALPNRPIANMLFRSYIVPGAGFAILYCQNLKLGHYMKVPPRVMFAAQVYAGILGTFVSLGVNAWMLVNITNFCQPDQSAHFLCPGEQSFFTEAILWGVVGPKRLFGSGGLYGKLPWTFLIGAVLPIPFWLVTRKYPNSCLRYIFVPIILVGTSIMAPFNFSFVWPACIVAFIFNYYIRRRYLNWWLKYAYVLTSSFGVAIALSAVVIFFAVQYHMVPISWWGNNVSFSGVDGGGETAPQCVLKVLGRGEQMPNT